MTVIFATVGLLATVSAITWAWTRSNEQLRKK